MTGPSRTALAVGVFGVFLALVYADPLWSHRTFIGRDLQAYNLPMEKTIHDAYARGRLPVWSAEISGGRPLLPNPNAGALYPIRALLALFSFPFAARLFPVLHWFAAAAGLILLLRSLGLSLLGCWVGASTYVFSGVVVSEVYFPHYLPGMALLPWILWSLHTPAMRGSRRIAVLAMLLALDLLAAEVFTILLALGCAVLWILVESERAVRGRRLLELLAAAAMASLAAAPQIVAAALWVGQTRRAVTGLTIGEVTLYSLSPLRLLELVVPYPFGATWKLEPSAMWGLSVYRGRFLGLFSTIYAGALPVLAVFACARRSVSGARFARVLLALGIGLSVLPGLLPPTLWSRPAPLALRNPEKFAVSIPFALAILAACAFELYRRAAISPRPALLAGLALAVIAVVCVARPADAGRWGAHLVGGPAARAGTASRELPAALVEAASLWMLTVLAVAIAGKPGASARAAALLLCAVPLIATRKIPQIVAEADALAPTAFARWQQKQDPEGLYRALGESLYRPLPRDLVDPGKGWSPPPSRSWTEHTQALWGRGTVFNSDFDSGDFARMETLRRISAYAAGFRDGGPFFGAVALKWGVRFHGQEPVPGFRRVTGNQLEDWDEHDRPFPDVRLLERWREVPGPVEAVRALAALTDGEVVVESGRPGQGRAGPGTVRVLERTPEHLSVVAEASDPTWLFVLREFWEWRTVRLDGKRVEAFPAQIAFSAVSVPAGRHRVEWIEEVPGGTSTRWGPLVFLLLFAAGLLRPAPAMGDRS